VVGSNKIYFHIFKFRQQKWEKLVYVSVYKRLINWEVIAFWFKTANFLKKNANDSIMKKILALLTIVVATASVARSQTIEPPYPEGPGLEFVCELRVDCGPAYTVGKTAHGTRMVIPILGGTFSGPAMKGEIIGGGADYQLTDPERGRNEVEAIYSIKTDDGIYIHIRNCGLISMSRNENGAPGFYFRTAPKFEAPQDSPYDWLNNAIFVCMPGPATDCICLRVWKVL
jgi:hypothetical protein